MNYNQSISTTTYTCVLDGANYCEVSDSVKVSSYGWADLLIYLLAAATLYGVVRLFIKRRR